MQVFSVIVDFLTLKVKMSLIKTLKIHVALAVHSQPGLLMLG